jgi:hypothetical protein
MQTGALGAGFVSQIPGCQQTCYRIVLMAKVNVPPNEELLAIRVLIMEEYPESLSYKITWH